MNIHTWTSQFLLHIYPKDPELYKTVSVKNFYNSPWSICLLNLNYMKGDQTSLQRKLRRPPLCRRAELLVVNILWYISTVRHVMFLSKMYLRINWIQKILKHLIYEINYIFYKLSFFCHLNPLNFLLANSTICILTNIW